MLQKQIAKPPILLNLGILIFCGVVFFQSPAFAEKANKQKTRANNAKPVQEVIVKVRAIRASHPNNINQEETKPLFIDKRLIDISSKLSGFEFRTYKLITEQDLALPVKKKTSINLTEKTVLNIRPTYTDGSKVGLWIKWTDSSGERTLIDTRMNFDSQESMLTGTNCKDNKALILAISAVPKTDAP